MDNAASAPLARPIETPTGPALQWRLARNCALTPRQFVAVYLLILTPSMVVACAFWLLGYPMVAPFALLEALVLTGAFHCHARHARDGEILTLHDGCLAVEEHCGGKVSKTVFQAAWVSVKVPPGQRDLLALSQCGTHVDIGRHLPPTLRRRVAQELRQTLARTEQT